MQQFMEAFVYPACSPFIAFIGHPHSPTFVAALGVLSFVGMGAACVWGASKMNARMR